MKRFALVSAWLACATAAAWGQDVKVETVVGGLTNPCGVAVQPETGVVFISDSGAGRVVRVVDGKLEEVITGFPKDVYGKGPMYDIGPLGLVFLDKNTLAVGDGGFKDGEEYIRVYAVPEAGKPAIDHDKDAKAKLGPLTGKDDIKPEGNLYALAASKTAIYVTCNGDDTKGWVSKAKIDGTNFGPLERSLPTKEATDVDAPVGITIAPEGQIVVGQMGEINKPKDGLLTFYSSRTGKMLMNLETGLYDITGLGYSPKTGLLYATDFAWMEPKEGGLFRLDRDMADGKQIVKAVKMIALDKPTALAFDKDGNILATIIGEKGESENASNKGQLVKITGALDKP